MSFSHKLVTVDGRELTALDIQKFYCNVAQEFLVHHANDLAADVAKEATRCVAEWEKVLRDLEQKNFVHLATWVDWAAKYQLVSALRARNASDARIRQIDFAYHDIVHDDVHQALQRQGMVKNLFSLQQVAHASEHAPQGTRACLRSQFIRAAMETNSRYSVDWTELTLMNSAESSPHMTVKLLDPFDDSESEEFKEIMYAMRQGDSHGRNNALLPLV